MILLRGELERITFAFDVGSKVQEYMRTSPNKYEGCKRKTRDVNILIFLTNFPNI